ncbi:MAG TPA: phosphate ABC transporter permease PstA, partial [Gemmataceae bacterium]|nr:phosphate ABC transporter permease PstA [Gemmataceae bacterium]
IRSVVLPYARPGIIGGCFLALGRALGETMAVTMLIGNSPKITGSLFALGDSIPSVIANQLDSARVGAPMYLSALIELGLALFLVTVIINILARWMISRLGRPRRGLTLWARLRGAGRLPSPVDRPEQPTPSRNGPPISTASPVAARRMNVIMASVLGMSLAIILVPLFHIFGYVVIRGATALNLEFFTNRPIDRPSGLGPALVGSAVMIGMATLWAVPLGILGALFLSEYRTSRVTPVVRFVAELLGGVPSIVIGMFAFALLVARPGGDYSAYAGAFALGVMMIPVVLRSSEESLRLVPATLRNASYALGASHWQTVVRVIVPAALPAIITGVFLSIARIAGETAPLLFTAFSSNLWPQSLNEPTPSLTYFIYNYSLHDQPEKWQLAWGGALVLLTVVMALNVGIRLVTGKRVLLASRAD